MAQVVILQHVTAESRVGVRSIHVRYILDTVSLGQVLFFYPNVVVLPVRIILLLLRTYILLNATLDTGPAVETWGP